MGGRIHFVLNGLGVVNVEVTQEKEGRASARKSMSYGESLRNPVNCESSAVWNWLRWLVIFISVSSHLILRARTAAGQPGNSSGIFLCRRSRSPVAAPRRVRVGRWACGIRNDGYKYALSVRGHCETPEFRACPLAHHVCNPNYSSQCYEGSAEDCHPCRA